MIQSIRNSFRFVRETTPKLFRVCFRDYYFVSFFILFTIGFSTVIAVKLWYPQLQSNIFFLLALQTYCMLMILAMCLRAIVLINKNDWSD